MPVALAIILALLSGIVGAVFGPVAAEFVKRRFMGPVLCFGSNAGWIHKTPTTGGFQTFYVRVDVTNSGRSQAERCEACIETVHLRNAAGAYVPIEGYLPVPVGWHAAPLQASINPDRHLYFALGFVPDPAHQQGYFQTRRAEPPESDVLCFFLDPASFPLSQPSFFEPGAIEITVAVYSANAKTLRGIFEVHWRGNWAEDTCAMQNELVVRLKAEE